MAYKQLSPIPVDEGGTGAQTLTGVLTGNGTSAVTANTITQYGTIIAGASNAVSSVAPSATTGVPLISQGSSSNPTFGTVVVAGGGTGATSLTGVLTGNGTSAVTANTITQYGVVIGGASNAVSSTAVGTSGQVLTSNGAGMDPTFQAVSGGDVSGPGSSTDNALSRWNGTGGDTLQDSTVIVTDNGEMTNASQPAFLAITSGEQTGVVEGTSTTVTYGNEIFDQNADYDGTNTFTAPVTGRYRFNVGLGYNPAGNSYTEAFLYIVSSNRSYVTGSFNPNNIKSGGDANTNRFSLWISVLADMDASDTVTIKCEMNVSGSGSNYGVGFGSAFSFFSGSLEC